MSEREKKPPEGQTHGRATAGTTAQSTSETTQVGVGAAAEQAGRSSAEAQQQGGRAVAQTAQDSGEAAAERMHHIGKAAEGATRRGAQMLAAGQQQFTHRMAEQLEQTGHEVGQAAEFAAENVRRLMVLPNIAAESLHDLQQGVAGAFEGLMRTNLEAAQELWGLANVSGLVRLQNRAMHSYLDAFIQSSTTLTRSIRGMADRTLEPLEQQREHRSPGRAEGQRQDRRSGCVGDVMQRDTRLTNPDDTVQHVAQLMRENDTGMLPVGEGDRLVGIVTDRDVALRLVADGRDPARTKVRDVMTPEIRYAFEDEDMGSVAENMAEQQVRRLPVLNRAKRLVGVVSLSDLARQGRQPGMAGEALGRITQKGGQHSQRATA